MPGIFISYRREDSGGYAQQLFDLVTAHFGKKQVFMDIDSIEAGADFGDVIRDRLAHCDVFLALIGRNWLRCTDGQGGRRLDHPGDFVRLEVAQALGLGMRIIPVLVGGAQMPRAEELPADISSLALHNAHEIPDKFFKQAARQLVQTLQASVPRRGWPAQVTRRTLIFSASGVSVLVGGVALTLSLSDNRVPAREAVEPGPVLADPPELKVPDGPARPPVIVREPDRISNLPPAVPGLWKIDRLDFTSDVVGPRKAPHLVWAASITIGDAWSPLGFAPDQTLYVWDKEHAVTSAVRNGTEEWACGTADGLLSPDGITPDGRIWLSGSKGGCCFNSAGEGGWFGGANKISRGLLTVNEDSVNEDTRSRKPSGTCGLGAVRLWDWRPDANGNIKEQASHSPIRLDGNCEWVIRDDLGRFYGGTDKGSVYCLSAEGNVLWRFDAGAPVSSPPQFSLGDAVFAVKDRLFSLRDGVVRWSIQLHSCKAAFVDKAGTIYVSCSEDIPKSSPAHSRASSRSIIAAVDTDGQILWKLQTPYTPAMLDPQGRLYLLDRSSVLCVAG